MSEPFYDRFGILTTSDNDGGDALHRESFARLASWFVGHDLYDLKLHFDEFVDAFRVSPGLWRRHPDGDKWYSNPWTTTRDQYVPLICLLVVTGQLKLLDEISTMLSKRWWFFPNTVNGWNDGPKKWYQFADVVTPEVMAMLEPHRWYSRLAPRSLLLSSMGKAGKLPSYDLGKGVVWDDNTACDDTCHIATLVTLRKIGWNVDKAFTMYFKEAMFPPLSNAYDNRVVARLKYWFSEMGPNPGFAECTAPFIDFVMQGAV